MKKIFITFIIFLLLPFSLISQPQFIEASWDIIPCKGQTNDLINDWNINKSMIETYDECFIIPITHLTDDPYAKNNTFTNSNTAKIIKFDNNGEVLCEIELQFDNNYYVENVKLDIWNDTINVFSQLTSVNEDHFVLMHAYLFDDMSMSNQNEIWRKKFDEGLGWSDIMSQPHPLIDKNGYRTFHFEYYTPMIASSIAIFLKLDDKYNVISEYEYDIENDLNGGLLPSCPLMYNADSTQYYYVSYPIEYPYYYSINVLDMDFNLVERIPLESNPPVHLQAYNGGWYQNPYDGKIYAFGNIYDPIIEDEICVFKIDVGNDEVDLLRLSYTDDKRNLCFDSNCLCFLPDGKIIGCAIYDVDLFLAYKPDAYYAYIPVFDTNMKKISEWYYSIGHYHNIFPHSIYLTKDNGVILMGDIRFMIDDEIYWEPYIVKFPASAFDTDNLEEAHAHGLKAAIAYPNPGGDVMNIRTALRNTTLQVYDMQGRKVHEQEITDDVTSIDASKWESGTYVWKLGTVNGNEVEGKILESGKWVKE